MFYETITGNFFQCFNFKASFLKKKKNWSKAFYLKALRLKTQHFHTKLLCQKPMLTQTESEYKIDLSQRTAFCQSLFYLFRNFVSFKAPRIKSWFDVPTTQMPLFILFERVGSFAWGCISRWVSLKINEVDKLVKFWLYNLYSMRFSIPHFIKELSGISSFHFSVTTSNSYFNLVLKPTFSVYHKRLYMSLL